MAPNLTLQEIKRSWEEFYNLPFPNGVCDDDAVFELASIDSFAAGCIDTFVENDGALDTERIDVLEKCALDLKEIQNSLKGDALFYSEKLFSLIETVLSFENRDTRSLQG